CESAMVAIGHRPGEGALHREDLLPRGRRRRRRGLGRTPQEHCTRCGQHDGGPFHHRPPAGRGGTVFRNSYTAWASTSFNLARDSNGITWMAVPSGRLPERSIAV